MSSRNPTHIDDSASVLRWTGSKRSLLPRLTRRLPSGNRYFEPFVGSGCLFFSQQARNAVIGDQNAELVNFYVQLRDNVNDVHEIATQWTGDRETYYEVRSLDAAALDRITRAARFLFLNRYCFNGLYRTNRQGHFNVPFGSRTGSFPTLRHLRTAAATLRDTSVRVGDFEATTNDAQPGDVIYLDPPYAREPAQAYGVYGYGGFDGKDLLRMICYLQSLDERGIGFLFSYADVASLRDIVPSHWKVESFQAPNQVAAKPSFRGRRPEVLIYNR